METTIVGKIFSHDSASSHVDGRAIFIDDLPESRDLLHLHLVTSPWAHANNIQLDFSKAMLIPGVISYLTAKDIPGINEIGAILPGEPLIPDRQSFYLGHPLAAIAAISPEIARRAAGEVIISGEERPAIFDIQSALDKQDFVCDPMVMRRGDLEKAFSESPHCLSGEIELGGQDHFYLETQVALVTPIGDKEFHIYSSTQHPTEIQHHVAQLLNLPQAAISVEVRRLGGAFGGKESQAALVAGMAALMANKTRRPVKLRLNRDDDMIITGKRHEFLLKWKAGFDPKGQFTAVEILLVARCGWSTDLSPGVISRALSHADNAYYYPAVQLTGLGCRTNTQSNTAFRGFGAPQGMMAAEIMIDRIARFLNLDPLDVRKNNLYRPGRDKTPYHQIVQNFELSSMIEQLERTSSLKQRIDSIKDFNKKNAILKKGIALSPVKFGVSFNNIMMNQAGALVLVYADGSVLVNHGGIEMGQGLYRKVAQIVAEIFQLPITAIQVSATRTDKVPNTSPTAASSGTDLNGMAAKIAAETIRQRMAQVAAEHFSCPIETIEFKDGIVGTINYRMTFAELAHLCHTQRVSLSSTGFYKTPDIHFDKVTMTGSPFYYYAYGCAVSEVIVDGLTGEWKTLRVDILHDVGRSLNPGLDRGQIEGAFLQGVGWLLLEEMIWDGKGALLTHAPSTYKIPTARDLPKDFRVDLLEHHENRASTIFRSKAVGEPPLMLAISVWLAVRDAVCAFSPASRWQCDLAVPATPEHILRAIRKAKIAHG